MEYVPGEFKCPACGFVVIKSIMYVNSGTIGSDSRDILEPCPNDQEILRPVKMIDALNEARADAIKFMTLYAEVCRENNIPRKD